MAWDNSTRSSTLPSDWPMRRARVLERDEHKCKIRYADECIIIANEVDHIRDRLNHSYDNLQAACAPCNARKNINTRPLRRQNRRAPEPHPLDTMDHAADDP